MVMLYRIINNFIEVPPSYHPTFRENQPPRGHQRQLVRLQPNVDAFKFSFLPLTVVDWNNLDDSISNFKKALFY